MVGTREKIIVKLFFRAGTALSYACGDYLRLKILCIFNRVYEMRSLTPCGLGSSPRFNR